MVLRGQFLERPALVRAGEVTLEGLSRRGARAPPLLLCPPARAAALVRLPEIDPPLRAAEAARAVEPGGGR